AAFLVLGALLLVGGRGTAGQTVEPPGSPAGESPGFHAAGLVIVHGDGTLTHAYVPFAEDEISGLDLLERSGAERVTTGFGALGAAVCSLEGEGCDLAECRRTVCQGAAGDPFWTYFRIAGEGWEAWPLGASSARVRDGDVHLWAWTGGEVDLPVMTLDAVRELAGAPDEPGAGAPGQAVPAASLASGVVGRDDGADDVSPRRIALALGLLALVGGGGWLALRRTRAASRS
ncbi:MAG: hypothetical protein M3462_02375, partial [Chloroflexota bacterium]|nr:hypothetical protein [Chloroflexota bacterium]